MILIIRQNLKLAHQVWRIGPNFCPLHHTILESDKTDSSSNVNLQVKHVRRVLCAWVWEMRRKDAHHSCASLGRTLEVWVQLGSNWSCWHVAALAVTFQSQTSFVVAKNEIQKHKSKRQSQRLYNLIYVGSWCPEPSGRRTRGVALVLGIQRVRWPPGRWPLYEIPLDLHLSLLGGGNCLTCL